MRKIFFVVVTFLVMLITSGFVVRIVDATVQIDDDIGLLATLLAAVNAIVGVWEATSSLIQVITTVAVSSWNFQSNKN